MSKSLYVCCRHDDGAGTAGRLRYRLAERYSGDALTFATDAVAGSAPKPPEPSSIFLVVIGRSWLDACDPQGNRRLDNPHDPVREQVTAALQGGSVVIPILVDGARMPRPQKLAVPLRDLTRRRPVTLTQEHFDAGVRSLMEMIDAAPDDASVPPPPASTSVPVTITAAGMNTSRSSQIRSSAFVASRVEGPVKRERIRRALIGEKDHRSDDAGTSDFLEWFRIFGPLTIYVLMVAFFAFLAS